MGIGVIGLSTSQKREVVPQPGPPFTSDSADNGLSVDPVTGKIVLGNDFDAPGSPAMLLSNREIITDETFFTNFSIILRSINQLMQAELNGASLTVTGDALTNPSMNVLTGVGGSPLMKIQSGDGGIASFQMRVGPNLFEIDNIGNSDLITMGVTNSAVPVSLIRIIVSTLRIQVGSVSVGSNRADFQVSGTASRRLVIEVKTGPTYNVDRGLDSDIFLQNQGAVNFVLPSMVAANNREGFVLRVNVADAAGVTITAVLGQVIRFGSLVSSSGGTLSSTDVGACVTCVWDNQQWVTVAFVGAWSIT